MSFSHTHVHPDFFHTRLSVLSDASARAWAQSIGEAAFACLGKIQVIDTAALEAKADQHSPQELWCAVQDATSDVWNGLDELQKTMQPLVLACEQKENEKQDAAFDEFGPQEKEEEEGLQNLQEILEPQEQDGNQDNPNQIVLEGIVQRIAETAWTMSFVLSSEVQGFQKRVPHLVGQTDPWELIGDLQDHLGRLRSAFAALLSGILTSFTNIECQTGTDEAGFELTCAKELRARVFQLRDQILDIENQLKERDKTEWKELIDQAREAIDFFMFGPGFAWMRASDKSTFLKQQQAIKQVSEFWSPFRSDMARRVIDTLARYLEALEILNQRECLVVHDRKALSVVTTELDMALKDSGPRGREALGRALSALSDAQGRDRELDRLLAQILDPTAEVPKQQILERAQMVLAQLGS